MPGLHASRRKFAYDDVPSPCATWQATARDGVATLVAARGRLPNHSAPTRSGSCRSALRVGYGSKAMLWDATAINGYAIEASDGRPGTVSGLLFEGAGWVIRWLVVDTGHWLPGRKIHLPLSPWGNPIGRCATSRTARMSTRIGLCHDRSKRRSMIISVGIPTGGQLPAYEQRHRDTIRHAALRAEVQTWLVLMFRPMRVIRISAASQLSPGTISTPPTGRSVMSRISS
jgi:hypothetical protein